MSIIKENALKRMKWLSDNQPHDHEWDCPYEETEYFILKAITQPVFSMDSNDFEENPLLSISVYNIQKEIRNLVIDLKLGYTIENLLEKYEEESLLKYEILSVFENYLGLYNGYQYFGRLAASDVLLQSIICFFERGTKEDYDPSFYPMSSVWIEVMDEERNQIGEENLPMLDVELAGWLKCKVKNREDNNYLLTFLYWDGSKFKASEKEDLNFDIVDVMAWKEIIPQDFDEYLHYRKRVLLSAELENFDDSLAKKDFENLKRYTEAD